MFGFADGFIVIGRIKLGTISTPGGLLDCEIDVSKTVGRYTQGNYLTDSHYHVPGNHFDFGRRKSLVVLPELGIDFIERFRLVMAQENREKDSPLLGIAAHWRVQWAGRWGSLFCAQSPAGH